MEENDIRDITPPDVFTVDPKGVPVEFWVMLLGWVSLTLLAFAVLGVVWWIRRGNPERSLRRRAIRDIIALDGQADTLPASEWTAGLAGIVRSFLHQQSADPALFETTRETMQRQTDDPSKTRFHRYLEECDQWKYAGAQPDDETRRHLVEEALAIIQEEKHVEHHS